MARVTGVVAILCALFGFLYNAQSLAVAFSGGFTDLVSQGDMAYFYPAFYLMSGVCIAFYSLLLPFGVCFVRLQLGCASLLAILLAVEVTYLLLIGVLWAALGEAGMSVAGATGVANGGLMAQFIILFPLWGPIAAIWSRRWLTPEMSAT